MRFILFVGLLTWCTLFSLNTVRGQAPTTDTIFIYQRDTVLLTKRDTVYLPGRAKTGITKDNAQHELPESRDARLQQRREQQQAALDRRREELDALPSVRGKQKAWAFYYVPTKLLDFDFAAVSFSANLVKKGRVGISTTLGFLTRPTNRLFSQRLQPGPEATYGLRGLDLGLETRYYLSGLHDPFPFFLAMEGSYGLALVTYNRYLPNNANSFRRFRSVEANGQRIEASLGCGWEARSAAGPALDISMGIDLGVKGIFTEDPDLIQDLNFNFFEVDRFNGYASPYLRLGVGFGKW